ncbi:MAG: glycosyltransferase [Candidatus Omnitrophica bacterium]|nr:glycosyltransferase [Candidatus Omnitrophota bacterium]
MIKLALIRSCSSPLRLEAYHCQEIAFAKALAAAYPYEVDIYAAFDGFQPWEKRMVTERVRLIHVPYRRFPGQQGVHLGLLRRLGSDRYDVWQYYEDTQLMSMACALAKAVGRFKGRTVLYQGMYQDYRGVKRAAQKIYALLANPLLRRFSDVVLAKTDAAKVYLERAKFKNVRVVPVGLDDSIGDEEEGSHACPAKLSAFINVHRPVFLYAGVVEPRRNPEFLLRLFHRMKKEYPDAGLVYIGNGPLLPEVMELKEALGLDEDLFRARRLPHQALKLVYQTADIFLLPSGYEIYGMVILECVWFGLPLVSLPNAGAAQIKRLTQFSGLRIQPKDFTEWEKAVREVLAIPRQQFISESMTAREKLLAAHFAKDYDARIGAGMSCE